MDANILIICSQESSLADSADMLASAGHSADCAASYNKAEEMLEQKNYRLLLVHMPEDYADAVHFIRNAAARGMNIIAASDSPSQESLRAAVMAGAKNYLKSPVSASQIEVEIKKALSSNGNGHANECKCSDITPEMISRLDEIVERNRTRPGCLIPVLQETQELIGYLPVEIQKRIAAGLNITESEVHGVVSFYSFFTMKPKGKNNVRVCLGTACYVKGAEEIVKKISEELKLEIGGMSEDRKFSLETVRCVGACGLAPVVVVGKDTLGDVHANSIMELLKKYD
ncbi:MAG: NAD(P)H-dependent oxidoreductase subunit E [Nitrospiraceae bacterium]|nr:NAD(P)H-dependent oxidoreductase subunit E [Nitrospiraceae bacterium]